MAELTNCDYCNNYVYDDEDECYICDMNLDEDDIFNDINYRWF